MRSRGLETILEGSAAGQECVIYASLMKYMACRALSWQIGTHAVNTFSDVLIEGVTRRAFERCGIVVDH